MVENSRINRFVFGGLCLSYILVRTSCCAVRTQRKKKTVLEEDTPLPIMPLLPITSPSTVELCNQFNLRSTDIFICSYPKSGTTWTQNIVFSLLNVRSKLPLTHISEYSPFFEIDKHWDAKQGNIIQKFEDNHSKLGRRVFNTHLVSMSYTFLIHHNFNICHFLYYITRTHILALHTLITHE